MDREINSHSIRDLEKQIEEDTGDIIQLKRARNSLLNIYTRVPPELLGSIFRWNIIPEGDFQEFAGSQKDSYNFLLVCHHWFEVASHTPELWNFWGNPLEQWWKWYPRSGAATVDLVLSRYRMAGSDTSFSGLLQDAVRDRAARNTIRSIHLQNKKKSVVTSIISSLTPDGEGVRSSSIESIGLRYVDVSELFARCSFPKLWYLHLSKGINFSSWECLGLHTTALTTLHLAVGKTLRDPSMSQILSILAANPCLQNLTLSSHAIPRDGGDGSTFPVPLCHLKNLSLRGAFHRVFRLLHQLDHPEEMGNMTLILTGCTVVDILGTLGPYLRDCLRCDWRVQDRLGIFVNSFDHCISIQASTISDAKGPTQGVVFATFTTMFQETLPLQTIDNLCIGFVTYAPIE